MRTQCVMVSDSAVRASCFLTAVSVPVLTCGFSARADQIVSGGRNFTGAAVVGFHAGELTFRSADGRLTALGIEQVDMIIVDRGGVFADFNQAERFFAGGEPARALSRYRRTHRLVEGFWPKLIASRLALASDAAGRLDEAVRSWIAVLRAGADGPATAARIIPRNIPDHPDARVGRAVEEIDAALSSTPPEPQRTLLLLTRFDVLRRSSDPRASAAAANAAAVRIPKAAQSERAFLIQLAAFEKVVDADRRSSAAEAETSGPVETLTDGASAKRPRRSKAAVDGALAVPQLRAALDQAIRDFPDPLLPRVLLLKGEVLLRAATTDEDLVRAAMPFMRAAIHFPDRAEAAGGLYGAARAHERLGLVENAVQLLEECLGHSHLTDETRRAAETARNRLVAAGWRENGGQNTETEKH